VSFGVVGVEQAVRCPTLDRCGQLPAEVRGVLDAHAHPLPTGRQMDVRGVAGEQDPAAAIFGDLAGGVGEGR